MRKEKKKHLERLAHRRMERRQKRLAEKKTAYSGQLLAGTVAIAPAGFGFVKLFDDTSPKSSAEDWFIPAKYLNGAMHGDSVLIAPLPPDPHFSDSGTSGTVGQVIEITRHARATLVGQLVSADRVRALDRHMPDDVLLTGNLHGARKGDWVEVELDHAGKTPLPHKLRHGKVAKHLAGITGTVIRKLGQGGILQADLDAVCAEYGLPEPFSVQEEEQACGLEPRETERMDLRDRFTLTIDPFDAKDYDDAISIAEGLTPESMEVGVHIAEVAAYLPPGSHLDRLASARGFTAYLPGRTIRLLPEKLTAKLSMSPGTDSIAHTVLLDVNRKTGEVLSSRRVHSQVRVKHQLNYGEVQDFLDGGAAPEHWGKPLASVLTELHEITSLMRKWRKEKELFLDLPIPEIRVICDEAQNKILGLDKHLQRPSEQMVEECMLAANVAVAMELTERNIPGLFRIHTEPEPEKFEEFSALSETAFHIPTGDLANRQNACKYLEKLPDGPEKMILLNAFLRSMPRACYQEEPSLHYGLGKTLYSHFTSPIRRYTDLLVHQQLWAMDMHEPLQSKERMKNWGEKLSELETEHDEAYFAASSRMKFRYLEEQLKAGKENVHAAFITKVTNSGVIVELTEFGIQGNIAAEDLPGGYRSTVEALKQCYPGKTLTVSLDNIDFIKASATFRVVRSKATE